MSLAKKIIVLLVVLALLIGSWFFMNKKAGNEAPSSNEITQTADELDPTALSQKETIMPSADSVSEKGNISTLPILPVLGQRGIGDPNAPVKIQEFFSLTCNHCADFHADTYPELKSKFIDTGKAYFVFQEFPLNGPALYGSMIARCVPENRYASFIGLLLKNVDVWAFGGDFKSGLMQNAKLAGMSEEEFEACFNNKELQEDIAQNISNASESYQISSTPTFVFNDGQRIMRGNKGIEAFEAVIEELTNNTAE
jgi:protein-disulfide isomerase